MRSVNSALLSLLRLSLLRLSLLLLRLRLSPPL
jgi:hypothetical protein